MWIVQNADAVHYVGAHCCQPPSYALQKVGGLRGFWFTGDFTGEFTDLLGGWTLLCYKQDMGLCCLKLI